MTKQERWGGLDPDEVKDIAENCGNCEKCPLTHGYFEARVDVFANIKNQEMPGGEVVKMETDSDVDSGEITFVCVHPDRHERFTGAVAALGVELSEPELSDADYAAMIEMANSYRNTD